MNTHSQPNFEPGGVATGIGSLPYSDADEALSIVFKHVPQGPFWPQLPRRTQLEGMTLQYVPGLPGLIEENGTARLDTGATGQEELTTFYERILSGGEDIRVIDRNRAMAFGPFVQQVQHHSGDFALVKGHITGPVTLASSLKDPEGREIINDPAFREAVSHHLAAHAVAQVRQLQGVGAPVVIFLDEPVMEAYGSAYSTLDEATVRGLWQPVLEALGQAGALSGIHCCGNTDWELLLTSGADIVNFDAFDYAERFALYAGCVEPFLQGGGVLAWGIVPTDERAYNETPSSILARLESGMESLVTAGVDAGLLRRRCLLTPACGLGSVPPKQATQVLTLLQGSSAMFRQRHKQY